MNRWNEMAWRILFVSFACYLDDANGAAVATRAMLEHLARRGCAVEALCGPWLPDAVGPRYEALFNVVGRRRRD